MELLLIAAAIALLAKGGGARTPAADVESDERGSAEAPRPAWTGPTPPRLKITVPDPRDLLPGREFLPGTPPLPKLPTPKMPLPKIPTSWLGAAWERLPSIKLPSPVALKASPLDVIQGVSGFVKGFSAGNFYDYSEWARQHPTLAATKEFAELGAMSLTGPAAPAAYVIGRVTRGFADFYLGKRETYWAEMGFTVPGTFAAIHKPPVDEQGHRTANGRWEVYYNFRDSRVIWSKGGGTTTIGESFTDYMTRTGTAPLSFYGADDLLTDSIPAALKEKIGDSVNLLIWADGGISFFHKDGLATFITGAEMENFYG